MNKRLAGLLLLGAMATAAYGATTKQTQPPTKLSTCEGDWKKCIDNADLAKNYSGMSFVKFACKDAAETQAKFGTPEWPIIVFGSFADGQDAVRTGVIALLENNAKLMNASGVMAHVSIFCKFDLATNRVVQVSIDQK